jgi:hypothetical protein
MLGDLALLGEAFVRGRLGCNDSGGALEIPDDFRKERRIAELGCATASLSVQERRPALAAKAENP